MTWPTIIAASVLSWAFAMWVAPTTYGGAVLLYGVTFLVVANVIHFAGRLIRRHQ